MRIRPVGLHALAIVFLGTAIARAQPETPGPLAVTRWDAGRVDAAGASIPTVVYYPTDGGGPYPVVGVIHGSSRTGANMRVMAETLASYGFIAVTPNMPCNIIECNHDENAAQLSALLDWAVAQGGTTGSVLAGLVDGERRGLIGHSFGALASHLAAGRDDRIDAVVLLDPNDDVGVGAAAAGSVLVPSLQLLAQVPGACNSMWNEAVITPAMAAPKLQLTLAGSAHCDPEDPSDSICPTVCGNGDRATTPFFRRYAVTWMACLLAADESVAAWAGGPSFDEDVAAGVLLDVVGEGLDTLPCRGIPGADADADGDADVDADADPDSDAGADVEADADGDAEDAADLDGGSDADGGADAGGGDGGGCGCRAPGARPRDTGRTLLMLLACGMAVRRIRRD
jgi:dienelactone hydrolase